MGYIVLALIAIVIVTPEVLWRIHLRRSRIRYRKEFLAKPFVCPNCGKRNICGRPYDLDEK